MTSQNDRQDRSLTGQVRDQAGQCPLTGRCFQPCVRSVKPDLFQMSAHKHSCTDLAGQVEIWNRPFIMWNSVEQEKTGSTCWTAAAIF